MSRKNLKFKCQRNAVGLFPYHNGILTSSRHGGTPQDDVKKGRNHMEGISKESCQRGLIVKAWKAQFFAFGKSLAKDNNGYHQIDKIQNKAKKKFEDGDFATLNNFTHTLKYNLSESFWL